LVVSHYARLYDMIHPTRAAVMVNGRIAVNGGPELIKKIDTQGYEWIRYELGISIEKEEQPMNKVSIGVCATREATKDK
jgi:Fe-S cluster assembly ATP-binding protein